MKFSQIVSFPGTEAGAAESVAVRLLVAFFGVASGWIVAQRHGLSTDAFFTPWHHDDFDFLSGFFGLQLFSTRPISSNVALFLGQFGAKVYFATFTLIVLGGLAVTVLIAESVFEQKSRGLRLYALSALGALAWTSQASSVQAFQYSGLFTNALSYLFGFSALLVFLLSRPITLRPLPPLALAAFGVLTFASAFAKEDQLIFLLAGIAFIFVQAWMRESFDAAARLVLAPALVVFSRP